MLGEQRLKRNPIVFASVYALEGCVIARRVLAAAPRWAGASQRIGGWCQRMWARTGASMPGWLEELRREAKAVASAPFLLAAIVLSALVAIWGALHWSYRATLSAKDRHIVVLERRVAEYRESVSGVTPDEAKRRIEALEIELKTLRLRLQPRRLTATQRQAILDHSRLPAGARPSALTVGYELDCADCKPFAEDLASALQTSEGWHPGVEILSPPVERPRYGLGIRVPDPLRPSPEAVFLQRALRSAELAFTMVGAAADPSLVLLVTERTPE
jgi:hypothetical protein